MTGLRQDESLDLIALLYDAVAQPERWRAFLERFADSVGSEAVSIFKHDLAVDFVPSACDRLSFVRRACLVSDSAAYRLERCYAQANLWPVGKQQAREGEVICRRMRVPDVMDCREWTGPQGTISGLGSVVLQRGSSVITLTAIRGESAASYSNAECALVRRLMPHLRRACGVHWHMDERHRGPSAALEILERLPLGVILLDHAGRCCFISKAAEAILQQRDGLTVDSTGRCRAEASGIGGALQRLIDDTVRLDNGPDGLAEETLALPRRRSPRPLSVLLSPLGPQVREELGACTVMFVGDPDRAVTAPAAVLSQLYGLTPAEGRLAAALANGEAPASYAVRTGLSPHTVHDVVSAVLSKTGVHRQAELVKLLLTSPATLCAHDIAAPMSSTKTPPRQSQTAH